MQTGVQRWFAWSGVLMCALFLVGFWPIAGFIPPPRPSATASEIAEFYAENAFGIRLGLWITMMAATLCGPWVVAITMQLKRIEGRYAPFSYLQLVLGAIFILEFIFPLMIWQAAAFRPNESPEITFRLNDLGWLMFVGVVSTGALQAIATGVAIIRDTRKDPVFPRWVGYMCLWCALTFLPAGLVVFFHSGPLAWNGLIAWWLLLVGFCIWVLGMSWALLRHAIPHQEREDTLEFASV